MLKTSIFTRLICYLWTKGGMKLAEKYALYSTVHSHHRCIFQPNPIARKMNIYTNTECLIGCLANTANR